MAGLALATPMVAAEPAGAPLGRSAEPEVVAAVEPAVAAKTVKRATPDSATGLYKVAVLTMATAIRPLKSVELPEPEPAPVTTTTQAPVVTAPAPAPEPVAPPAPAPAPEPAPAPAVASGSPWDQLAQCESGGNWAINTGNGYYGGLQFSLSSWQAVGGTGYPHEASRETQIAMGERLKGSQGWGAWPACSRKLGLR